MRIETLISPTSPTLAIAVPFSRTDYLETFLGCFRDLLWNPEQTHVIFLIDTDDALLETQLKTFLAEIFPRPNGITLIHMERGGPPSNNELRRRRIIQVHEALAKAVGDVSYVFGLEDDTVFPADCLTKFLVSMRQNPQLGFIEGVQVGRHDLRMIGGWRMDSLTDPKYIETVPYNALPVIEAIDAGGLYCFLTRGKLFATIERQYTNDPYLGPDVHYGIGVRQSGYQCAIDFSVPCGHLAGSETLWPDEHTRQLFIEKRGGRWQMRFGAK